MDEQEVEQEREYYYFAIKYCTENIFLLCAYSNSRSFKRSICMKNKKWISLAAAVVLAVTALPMGVFAAKKDGEEEKLTKVTLNEVAHSIFYAPQYVAIEEGYFAEEGLDLTLVTGFGADKVLTALISGEADIGFMGAEASIYAYQEGATDPAVNFAQLTQRAGNFLVAREEMPDFKWEDLKGKKVLGGRKGGMPEMVFEYILRKNGLDPQKDLTINQSIDFGSTAAAFTGDASADFTVEFEPSATALEKEGAGYVVASLGVDSGYVPYTSYSAKTSYMQKNPEVIQKFTNALQKGMEYVQTHTPEEIAKVIAPQFAETDLDTVKTIVKRYYDQDTWKSNLIFEKESFELLEDILEDASELNERVAYEDLVTTEYAEKAAEK
jgi:NitT/TauT family transport system substrate-binding protein